MSELSQQPSIYDQICNLALGYRELEVRGDGLKLISSAYARMGKFRNSRDATKALGKAIFGKKNGEKLGFQIVENGEHGAQYRYILSISPVKTGSWAKDMLAWIYHKTIPNKHWPIKFRLLQWTHRDTIQDIRKLKQQANIYNYCKESVEAALWHKTVADAARKKDPQDLNNSDERLKATFDENWAAVVKAWNTRKLDTAFTNPANIKISIVDQLIRDLKKRSLRKIPALCAALKDGMEPPVDQEKFGRVFEIILEMFGEGSEALRELSTWNQRCLGAAMDNEKTGEWPPITDYKPPVIDPKTLDTRRDRPRNY